MYRCKGTVGLCLMVPFFVFKHTKYIGPCACILEMLSSVKPQRRGVSKRKIPDVHSPVPGKIGGKNGEEKVSDAPYLYHHFGVILVAALLTCFIPLGKYDTKEITYTVNGSEKTRTVVDPDSFQYILDENGNKVTQAAPIFGTEDFGGRGGIVNYVFEGMTAGSRGGGAVAIIAFTLVVGGAFGIVLRTGAVEGGIMRVISLTMVKRSS